MSLEFYNMDNEMILEVDYHSDEEELTIYVMQVWSPEKEKWVLKYTNSKKEYDTYLANIGQT